MENATRLGSNKTGMQLSPGDPKEMLQGSARTSPPPGDLSAIAALRQAYISEAEPIGSVPPPGSVKGVVSSGVDMLTGKRPQVFMDKLGERIAFERTGTRLYDALIIKCEAAGGGVVSLDTLRQFRNEELQHFELVCEATESLGGDPTAQTPCADVAGVEAMGLVQVLTDPRTSVAQCLNAILVAELSDNAGWEMLSSLAEALGKDELAKRFRDALREEQVHLSTIKNWNEQLTLESAKLGGPA